MVKKQKDIIFESSWDLVELVIPLTMIILLSLLFGFLLGVRNATHYTAGVSQIRPLSLLAIRLMVLILIIKLIYDYYDKLGNVIDNLNSLLKKRTVINLNSLLKKRTVINVKNHKARHK